MDLSAILLLAAVLGAAQVEARPSEGELLELDTVVALVEQRYPALPVAQARLARAEAREQAAGRVFRPALAAQVWAAPLARPWAWDDAQMMMVGLRQELPAFGAREAGQRAAGAARQVASEEVALRRRDLAASARQAYFAYYRAHRQTEIRTELVSLAGAVVEQSRARYQTGRGSKQELLQAEVELARLRADLLRDRAEVQAATARLNTLMAQPAEDPLAPPADWRPPQSLPPLERLAVGLPAQPERRAGEAQVAAAGAEVDEAEWLGLTPRVMVGLDYGYMPMAQRRHVFSAMVSLSLPWFDAAWRDAAAAAKAEQLAAGHELVEVELELRGRLHEAMATYSGAHAMLVALEQEIGPRAEDSLAAAQAAYSGGQTGVLVVLDALRSVQAVRLSRVEALAEVGRSLTELERASGAGLFDRPRGETTSHD